MASATTPREALPMPRSTTVRSSLKKSVEEKRREEVIEWVPSVEDMSNATQKMRSWCASCLKALVLCANWQREVSVRRSWGVEAKASVV